MAAPGDRLGEPGAPGRRRPRHATGKANGWSHSTVLYTLDGLAVLLDNRTDGEQVTLTEIRARAPHLVSVPRVAEILAMLGLLEDDSVPAIRAWIDRRAGELPDGFAAATRDWMLVLLDGGARSRPRSHRTIYVYFNEVRPLIDGWSARRGHIREVTTEDIRSGLGHLSGWPLCNATMAVRSLFGFAKRQGLIFANPAQRLMIALAAVHAARWAAIRVLTLDDIDLPNRRITIAGHSQRLGDLSHQALRAWLDHRRATWPHTPNKHVLISQRTALGTDPVSGAFLTWNLGRHGISIERIRRDRVLHEALTARADPLHLAMVFGISQTAASDYALIARSILADAPITTQEVPSDQPVRCRAAGRRLAPPGRGCSGAGRQTRDPSWPV